MLILKCTVNKIMSSLIGGIEIKIFDSYSFSDVYFEDVKSGEGFLTQFDKEDRIYQRLLPFLFKGKAEGMKALGIDCLCVPTSIYADIKNKTFKVTANTIFRKNHENNVINSFPGSVVIERVCIDNIDPRNVTKDGDKTLIKMCDLVLQYQTGIEAICDMQE